MKAVKEQLHAIPNKGRGYSILRYLSSDNTRRERLQGMLNPELSFNYLGQIDRTGLTSGSFAAAQESGGVPRSGRCRRSHLLDVTAAVVGGQLQVNWTYSCNVHMRSTIETLASEFMRHLKALISHCLSSESGGYTPSDFDLARLDQAQLDKVLQKIKHKTTEH